MAARITVVEVRDDVTVLRCECEGIAPTMHTIMNTYIAAGNLQAEIDRIKAEADARAAAKAAAEAAINAIQTG
jgi:hypothetical protein